MNKFYIILISLLCADIFTVSNAQLRTKPIDQLNWYNPWISNGNMAGLTLNRAFLDSAGLKNVSEAQLSTIGRFGEFRNVFDPESGLSTSLGVESFSKVKKVYLYGRFDFSYDYDWNNSWRGSLHPYSTPFMLADPIAGNITTQFYSMEAGVGIPLSRWNIGVDVSYDAGIMAKLKDLRNSNTDMTFKIAPGVSYGTEKIDLGLSVGYERATEKVEYAQIVTSKENYLYYLYGMWVYNSYGYSSAETSRFNAGDRVYGNFTIDVHIGQWRLYDDFTLSRKWALQTENGYNNLIYGDTHTSEYRNKLLFQYNDRHRITCDLAFCSMASDRYLQQQEQDKASGIRRWVTYGTDPCWSRRMMNASLCYEYRDPFIWEIGGGLSYHADDRHYVCHPISITQTFNSVEPFIRYCQYVTGGGMRWSFSPSASYRIMTKSIENEVNCPEGTSVGSLQFEDPLAQEVKFFSSNTLTASLEICCDFWKMFIKTGYRISYAPTVTESRHTATLTIGYAF